MLLWFGHGCSVNRMQLEHGCYYGLRMVLCDSIAMRTRASLWFGHGCTGDRMLMWHERYYGLDTEMFQPSKTLKISAVMNDDGS